MKNLLNSILLSTLLVIPSINAGMEGTVYKAIMSYERPKQIRRYVNYRIEKELGKDTSRFLGAGLSYGVSNKLTFKIKYKQRLSEVTLKKDSIELNFRLDF